jgi:hypothetical protein
MLQYCNVTVIPLGIGFLTALCATMALPVEHNSNMIMIQSFPITHGARNTMLYESLAVSLL